MQPHHLKKMTTPGTPLGTFHSAGIDIIWGCLTLTVCDHVEIERYVILLEAFEREDLIAQRFELQGGEPSCDLERCICVFRKPRQYCQCHPNAGLFECFVLEV